MASYLTIPFEQLNLTAIKELYTLKSQDINPIPDFLIEEIRTKKIDTKYNLYRWKKLKDLDSSLYISPSIKYIKLLECGYQGNYQDANY